MGTKVKQTQLMRELYRDRTPAVEACRKVQKTVVRGKDKDGNDKLETTIIDHPCKRIDDTYCGACAFPSAKWRLGDCNLATHLYYEMKRGEPQTFLTPVGRTIEEHRKIQQKLNPIKASKRRR